MSSRIGLGLSGSFVSLVLMLLISGSVVIPLARGTTGMPLASSSGPDFALTVSPNQLTVAAGATATFNITVTSLGGFAGTVKVEQYPVILFYIGGLPHNFTLVAGGWSSLNVTVNTHLEEVGTFYLYFTATSGQLSQSASVTLTTLAEPDFTVSTLLSQPSGCPFGCEVNVTAGTSKQVGIEVKSYYNFTGQVQLSANKLFGADQLDLTLYPQVVTLEKNATMYSTLTVSVPYGSSFGGNWVYVNGTSGGKMRSTIVNVVVPMDLSFEAAQTPLTVRAGSSYSTTVTLSTNGFSRTLNITASAPSGLTPVLSIDRASVNSTQRTVSFTLTVSVASKVSPGTYYLTLTGTTVVFLVPLNGDGQAYERPENSNSTQIPVEVLPYSQPQPTPMSMVTGLDPALAYELLGAVALLGVIVAVVVLVTRPRKEESPR